MNPREALYYLVGLAKNSSDVDDDYLIRREVLRLAPLVLNPKADEKDFGTRARS